MHGQAASNSVEGLVKSKQQTIALALDHLSIIRKHSLVHQSGQECPQEFNEAPFVPLQQPYRLDNVDKDHNGLQLEKRRRIS